MCAARDYYAGGGGNSRAGSPAGGSPPGLGFREGVSFPGAPFVTPLLRRSPGERVTPRRGGGTPRGRPGTGSAPAASGRRGAALLP